MGVHEFPFKSFVFFYVRVHRCTLLAATTYPSISFSLSGVSYALERPSLCFTYLPTYILVVEEKEQCQRHFKKPAN